VRGLILTILLGVVGVAFSQDPVISLNITTKDDDTGKKLTGAVVVVKSGGSVFVTKTSASNGKVPPIDLPLGQNYVVYIQKDGYVTKVANIDGHYDYPEDLPPFIPFPIQTSLFREVEGVNFQWLETTPMIKFELDQYGNQIWDQAYTKEMLKKIAKLKEEIAEKKDEDAQKKKEFDQFVAAGDKNVGSEEYESAIGNYEKALALFDDADVKTKLENAKKALADSNKSAELEKKFQEKMTEAKTAFDKKEYEKALNLYKEASGLKPAEKLPKDRITAIEKILKEQKDLQANFDKFVADGDAGMSAEDYDKAIQNYESALGLKEDAAVKTKLENAKKKKEEKAADEEAAKALEEKYNQLIADADKAFDSKTYEDARSKYQEALGLKPTESHPAARISEIDGILKKQKEEEDAANKLEEDYKKLIAEGNAAFGTEDWDGSIAKYEEALKLKPGEQHPTDQIDLAKKNREKDAAEKELNEKYEALMAEGKSLKEAEKYQDAINKYKEAQGIKSSESAPKERIAEIEKILEDLDNQKAIQEKYNQLMADGNDAQTKDDLESALSKFEEALSVKLNDAEAKKKIAEVKKLIADKKAADEQSAKFDEFVKKGDDGVSGKNYEDAISNYQKALDIKDDGPVKAKIAEAEELLKKQKEEEQNKAKYEAAIDAADEFFTTKEWEKAIDKYNEALTFKDDTYPKDQITKAQKELADQADASEKEKMFNDLVAEGDKFGSDSQYEDAIRKYEEAINLKPDVSVSQKIADMRKQKDENDANKELQEKYKQKIKEADQAFTEKNWNEAKALYKDALGLKSNEQHPKDRLKEIDKKIDEENANEADKAFQSIIDKADKLRDEENFPEAIATYQEAIAERPSDSYAQGEINKINNTIQQREKEQADKDALEKKYKELISSADNSFNQKKYQDALKDYQEALNLKPTESHPTGRVKEIQGLLEGLDADAALKAKYDEAIRKADNLFDDGSYKEAKSAYQDALDIKSDEDYPKKRMKECDQKMQDESDNEVEKEYQNILTVAQEKMDGKDYDRALELFKRAKEMKPSDPIPQSKINEINKILADMDGQKSLDEKYTAAINKANDLFNGEEYKLAKSAYQDALEIKSDEQYPKDQIEICDQKMQNESVNEEEKSYQKLLKVAQEKFDVKEYDKSLDYYKRARGIRPSDPLPQQRIDEINQILNDLESEKGKRDRFNKLIQQADTHFEKSEWSKALDIYLDAMELFQEKYPKDQVDKCRDNIKNNGVTADKAYDKLIKKADEYFKAVNYDKAKGLYERAVGIKPSDQYPKDQLKVIDRILHPPKERVNKSLELTDYGPATNETPLDMEAMLNEAREQSEEFDLQEIYQQREDAQEALTEWQKVNEDETQNSLDATEELRDNIIEYDLEGDKRRDEATQEVEKWREDIVETNSGYVDLQENDVQFQYKRVEAMEIDISENQMDNDKPREEYEVDIEKIKIDNQTMIEKEEINQEDNIQRDKMDIDVIIESHVSNDPNNDVARLNTLVEVEDMQVVNINKRNEDSWAQEDENFDTKNEQTMLVDDIIANKLESDLPRQDTELIVEETTISYQNREEKNSNDQYDKNHDVKNETEKMRVDLTEDAFNANEQREGYEKVVEETTVSYQKREEKNAHEQENKNHDVKNETEKMRVDLTEDAFNANEQREGYEKVVEETTVSYQNREEKNSQEQEDKNHDVKNETEKMRVDLTEDAFNANEQREGYEKVVEETTLSYQNRQDKNSNDQNDVVMGNDEYLEGVEENISEFNLKADKNQVENADKNLDAIEDHIERIGDTKEQNDEELIRSENYIESLKDLNVNGITPEVANELGKKFPEGVTEETFTINDSRGIMKAFVVRRIVVIEGVGTVYERTQTRYGAITFTRNGQAILEVNWDDETNSGPRN
jgi:tetratricopeptide (TPR) repeat protein